jgi:phosphotransferase system  glucose/maltose/N-acetylglucosamine-specific IIC component
MLDYISRWKDKVAHYVDVRVQLIKLNLIERVSGVLSYFIFAFICLFLTVCVLIFLGVGLGEFLSDVFDSRAGGYFATAGIYALLLLLLFGFRKTIANSFSSVFIRIMTAVDEDEEEKNDNNSKTA